MREYRYLELTRGTRKMIKQAILNVDKINRMEICNWICFYMEDKFVGKNLEYQCNRMGLEHTGKVLDAIDIYVYFYTKK